MGLLSNPLRPREDRLPVYKKVTSPTKERYSSDSYYYSDDETEASSAGHSRNSSRSVSSSSISSVKRKLNRPSRLKLSPHRLPAKLARYVSFLIIGILLLFILSLVRASQVENWKVANGKRPARPPPPPMWEKFPFLERYYGGIRTLQPFKQWKPEYPRFDEEPQAPATTATTQPQSRDIPASLEWSQTVANNTQGLQECFLNAEKTIRIPNLRFYEGRVAGFPEHVGGSYDLLKVREDVCFERFGRFGPYGFGYSPREGGLGIGQFGENEGSEAVWGNTAPIDYRKMDWAAAQRRCFESNAANFKPTPAKPQPHLGFYVGEGSAKTNEKRDSNSSDANKPQNEAASLSRTAVVIRCWDEYFFREDDVANLRAMITELSLSSGGRYDIHLLVQVKNDAKHPIWADNELYQKHIEESVPEEFRGMVTMWTETQMLALYQGIHDVWARGPELPVHGAFRGLSMAMQHFAYMHPEYDYFWQWEMDIRYTGHYYDLLSKIEDWSKKQPRKGLWERNERYYIPSVHGTWEDFSQMARVQSEMGVQSKPKIAGMPEPAPEEATRANKVIWGPVRPENQEDWFEHENDPVPPTAYERDRYEWGVGEEADLITLNPIFNPEGTTWLLKDDITGYNTTRGLPPRRASIITTSRMSRRLLMSMHRATAFKKQFAFPEMWPATMALQHGYKAVYVPHPIYVDRKWPVEYLARIINSGHNGATGGNKNSVYGDREHNLRGFTWFYNSGFGPNLYKRWLGMTVNNDGGETFEKDVDETKVGPGVNNMPGGEGRMCLPPMLLHPVKEVDLPAEVTEDEFEKEEVPENAKVLDAAA